MTPLTLPAQPETERAGDPRPVPWTRMAWVTWRQHRAAFISLPVVIGVLSVFLVVAGVRVHSHYATLLIVPAHSAYWQELTSEFNSEDWTMGFTLLLFMQLVPVLIGAFAGAPLLARDLETGTFRYAWTQGLSRERWAIVKLAALGLFTVVVAAAFSVVFAWFFRPFIPQEHLSLLNSNVFGTRGVVFAAWTLTAFMIAAFGGMLLRQVIPAMAVTIGAYALLQLLAWGVLRPGYQGAGFWPAQFIEGGWLLALSVLLATGTVWLVRHRAALSQETSMTVHPLPARPARPAHPGQPDADAPIRPVPWRRLLWVAWRQHRAALVSVTAVLGVAALYLVLMGLKIHRDFNALTACHPATSDVCNGLANVFTGVDWRVSNGTLILTNLAPVLLGAFAGAPLLARDLETGTFRYLWTQGAGRVRSTVARLVLVGIFLLVLTAIVGELFGWFFGPALANASGSGMTVLTESVFHSRGFVLPAWTLATFAIGAFCGMLFRHTIPAMAVTMGAYAVLYVLTWLYFMRWYPVSLVTSNPQVAQASGSGPANIPSTNSLILGSWKTGSTVWWRYIPVTRFWPMQIVEASWLLVLSVLLIAATVWLARRRAA
jgi:hypothetical protein